MSLLLDRLINAPGKFLIGCLCLGMVGCVGIAVPIPWFPDDPNDSKVDQLELAQLRFDDVLRRFGTPWAVWDEKAAVYIAGATGSKLFWFYGIYTTPIDGGVKPLHERDYMLMIEFDSEGLVSNYELYKDSGRHNHCFANGICFKPESLNTPLAPESSNVKAKVFETDEEHCVVYLYRDNEGPGDPSSDYADISIGIEYPGTAGLDRRIYGTSVKGGFFRWALPPADRMEVSARYDVEGRYPFSVKSESTYRARDIIETPCVAGDVLYARLYIPRPARTGTEFELVEAAEAQEKIQSLNLLLDRYVYDPEIPADSSPSQLGRLLSDPDYLEKATIEKDEQ